MIPSLRKLINISESMYYKGPFNAYGVAESELIILENPTPREIDRLLEKSKTKNPNDIPELRGILTTESLYVWISYDAEHSSVANKFSIHGLGIYAYEKSWKFEDYYLRHPDLREEALELLDNPMIVRAFGETDFGTEGCTFPR
jgi:hypothetical protein